MRRHHPVGRNVCRQPAPSVAIIDVAPWDAPIRYRNERHDLLPPRYPLAAKQILRLAAAIEHNPFLVAAWYRDIPIAELGNLTARELVCQGRAAAVLLFLGSIQDGRRG